MTTAFRRISNADALAALQEWYPEITAFTWGSNGEANVETPGAMSAKMRADVIYFINCDDAWEAVGV